MWYLIDASPLQEGNIYEMFNEVIIYICTMILMHMLDSSTDSDINIVRGYVFIALAGFNLIVNIAITAI